MAIRRIFGIPVNENLPLIRKKNAKITKDENECAENKNDPVPFESNNPNVIIYLRRLVE